MKYLCILLCLFIGTASRGQNLLTNPSFSDTILCPLGLAHVNACNGWTQNTGGTSDYFNACATTSTWVDVPMNYFGYQTSPSNSYLGLFTYTVGLGFPNYKEYVATTFSPLVIGAIYKVTVIVSLADSCRYASDGLGIYFSTQPVSTSSQVILPFTPQIDYSTLGVIDEKINWIPLTKYLVADSAYTNLTIGCFKTNSELAILGTSYYSNALPTMAYYYIDSVAVEKVLSDTSILYSNFITGNIGKLSPNPFTNYATLTFNNDSHNPYTLDIYNIQGRRVRTINDITTGNIRIERDNLEPGFYYYKLYGANDIVGNGRFIIKD